MSLVPVYDAPDASASLRTQLLYGELIRVPESRKAWSRIRCCTDATEGWIRNDQWTELEESVFEAALPDTITGCAADLVAHACTRDGLLIPVLLGSGARQAKLLEQRYEGSVFASGNSKDTIVQTALLLLNSPEMAGGRSPFGIDSGGLAQLAYQSSGQALKRQPGEQALQGRALSFIEESEPGDLAFFDGPGGVIHHVGIIMKDNYIIHCHGRVRIDRIDHTGIFNADRRTYTHPLRVIKQILPE